MPELTPRQRAQMERLAAKSRQEDSEVSLGSARVCDLRRRLALVSEAAHAGRPVDMAEYLAGSHLFAPSA